mgnify:CR=1 FL=1
MIRTVIQGNLHVHHGEASHNAGLQGTLDTGIDSGNELLGDGAANDSVDELVTLAGLVGLDLDLNMTVLALTTRLTCVLGLLIGLLADGLTVSDLRCADIGLDLELTQQAVDDDLQICLLYTSPSPRD